MNNQHTAYEAEDAFNNNQYQGKPYLQYPVKVKIDRKLKSVDAKFRNVGLQNVFKTVDMNNYQQFRKVGQAEGIRKLGKSYQKKLQDKYDRRRIYNSKSMSRQQTVNYDRDVRQWYGERIKQANCCYLEYMKKVQKELGENAYGKQEKQKLLEEMNKVWQEKVPEKLKKCFES